MDDLRAGLARSHGAVVELLGRVPDEGWGAPTPCDDWDVAALVRHLVAGERIFAALVTDGAADRESILAAAAALTTERLPTAYDEASAALRAAYAQPGATDRPIRLPIGELSGTVGLQLRTTETLTHAWDLSRALGLTLTVDPDLVETAIAASEPLLASLPPGRPVFGTPQPVAPGAAPLDRLAALLGRTV